MQIPISNACGLLSARRQHEPDLTKGAPGSSSAPRASRTTTSASSPRTTCRARPRRCTSTPCSQEVRYIIDDTETFGKGVADTFQKAFESGRGKVVKHDAAPKTTQDYVSIMTAAKALNPEAIYFGGVTATGGARILLAAAQVGLGDIPYVGPDGINDGSGATKDSFLNLAGDKAARLLQHAGRHRHLREQGQFDADYKAEYADRRHGLCRPGLRVRADRPRRHRAGRRDEPSPRHARPSVRRSVSRHVDTTPPTTRSSAHAHVRCRRRHEPAIVSVYSFDARRRQGKGLVSSRRQVDAASSVT